MDEILKQVTGKFENLETRLEVVKEKDSQLLFWTNDSFVVSAGCIQKQLKMSRVLLYTVLLYSVFEIMASFLIFYLAFVRIQRLKEDLVTAARGEIPSLRADIMRLTVEVAAFMELLQEDSQESTLLVPTKELLKVKLKTLKVHNLKSELQMMENMVNEISLCDMSVANWYQKMIIYLAFASAVAAVLSSIVSHRLFCS